MDKAAAQKILQVARLNQTDRGKATTALACVAGRTDAEGLLIANALRALMAILEMAGG